MATEFNRKSLMKRSIRTHFPIRLHSTLSSSKALIPSPDSDHRPLNHHRRCVRNLASAPGKRDSSGGGGGGRRSGPTTPLLRWKYDNADVTDKPEAPSESARKARRETRIAGRDKAPVSARKLATWIWQMQLEPSVTLHNPAMERETKWNAGCSKPSEEVFQFYGHSKLLEDQQTTTVSVVSALQGDLEQARARINELEFECRSSKKKTDHSLRKFAEEKASWRSREHEKVRAVIDDLRDDVNREMKNRKRMEIVNSKLVNEIAKVKSSAKRFLQDYENERKDRELMEEVCEELAKEIGEDKSEVEALKRESTKIREEVEEERKMLQMAEVWREERVQMKLIDAKLTLEERYSQLSKLQKDLEAILRADGSNNPNASDIQEAELLKEAVNSVIVQDIKEFPYQPPPVSEDIFAVFEELQCGEETNEREIEPCYSYSPASRASNIHTVSPEINGFNEKPAMDIAKGIHTNETIDGDVDLEDDSGWETVTHAEEQGSSNSPQGSDPSVNGECEESIASVSGTDWEVNGDNGKFNGEISEVDSGTTRQSRKKGSSLTRLWRASHPATGETYKTVSVEATNGRFSTGRISNGTLSSDRGSGEVGVSPPSVGHWSSPDSVNPHIPSGRKGCIEWTRGMQKHRLKAKLLEASMESQKIQLREALKRKI